MSNHHSTGALDDLLGSMKSAAAPFRATMQALHEKHRHNSDGKVADYIPELALADPNWFGISVVTIDGQSYDVGDSTQLFSIQSVSKPFVFGLALDVNGRDAVLNKVGVEPTGEAFNAIVLDEQSNRPFNPLVNAGAIAIADLVPGKDFSERISACWKPSADSSGTTFTSITPSSCPNGRLAIETARSRTLCGISAWLATGLKSLWSFTFSNARS